MELNRVIRETELGEHLAAALWRSERLHDRFVRRVYPRSGQCLPVDGVPLTVGASKRHPEIDGRETDIYIEYANRPDGEPTHILLLELKINAPFGIGQVAAYGHRCTCLATDQCRVIAGVIAPQRYLASHAGEVGAFDFAISLEDLQADLLALAREATNEDVTCIEAMRAIHEALELSKAGSMPLYDELLDEQFNWYFNFAASYAPEAGVRPKEGKKQARDIFFDSAIKGFGYLKHRLYEGRVVVELMGWSPLEQEIRSIVSNDMAVERVGRTNSTLHILRPRAGIVPLEEGHSFDDQESTVREAIDEIIRLKQWQQQHRAAIERLVASKRTGGSLQAT